MAHIKMNIKMKIAWYLFSNLLHFRGFVCPRAVYIGVDNLTDISLPSTLGVQS